MNIEQKSRIYVVDSNFDGVEFAEKYPHLAVSLEDYFEDFDKVFSKKAVILVLYSPEILDDLKRRGIDFEVINSDYGENLEVILSEKLKGLSMFNSGFSYKGVDYSVEFHSLIGKKVPDEAWCQVYVVGDLDGKVPVVIYDKKGKESRNLPGGGVEIGEGFEDTLRREVLEELNMEVLSFEPLGHQINYGSDGKIYHQLRVYAKLKRLGGFKKDIGGSVIGYDLVYIDDLNRIISWGEVGDWFSLVLRDRY